MGAKQGKGNQSKCSSTLTAHEEMHGRGRGMGLPAIIEQENLLEKPEKKFGDREECHQSLLYESDEETRGWETPQRLVKHRERIRAVRSGSCNSDTSFDQPKDSFSIRSDTAGSVTKITSDYSSWEEEEGRPTNMIHQCSKETCSSCSSSNFPMKRPQNDSQLLSPDIRGERRTSVVQFADDEPKSDKKRRLSPASKIFQSVNSRNQRRSTVGNVYDQIISSQFDDRRGSMPPNLNRNQLGHSSKKTFTVVNYGKVEGDASETVPTGRESVTVLELLDDDDDTPGSPTPSIVLPDVNNGDKGVQQDDPIFQVVNVGGGRRLSVFHINNVISPDADKVFEDEVDCPHSVAVTVEDQTKCNASVEKRNRQVQAMVTWGKDYGRRKKDRLVNKDGVINIRTAKISKRNYQFMLDLFTTLLDLQWRWVWFLFAVAFLLSWFGFGVIWWLIAWLHGDFEPRTGASPPPCIDNLDGLISAFLYSIETQHTIGYGSRALSTECPLAFVALIAQSLLGVIVQCVMAGVVFAKLAKPKNRAETVMFSSTANICLEDGEYCLVFRVGDMRRSQLVGCNLRAFLVRRHVTLEGRVIPFHTSHLHVSIQIYQVSYVVSVCSTDLHIKTQLKTLKRFKQC